MPTIRMIATLVAAGGIVVSSGIAKEPAPPALTPDRVLGEWSQLVELGKPGDILLVMTFRKSGICRIDAIDRMTRKKPEGPDIHLPGVGLWKVDGPHLLIVWEKWSPARQRPIQSEERLLVETLDEMQMVTRIVLPNDIDTKVESNRWTRHKGWDDAEEAMSADSPVP
ncbi:MAG: hypothetical protein IT428_18255 [Planctomycetaceae bacterium]|nr:hypothetical protein [Planctomycetaceae bacterium]